MPCLPLALSGWDALHALAASGAGKEFLVGVNPQVVLPVESH